VFSVHSPCIQRSCNAVQVPRLPNESSEEDTDDPDYMPPTDDQIISNEVEISTSVGPLGRIKRKRNKIPIPEHWRDRSNSTKKLREQGKKYDGWKKERGGKSQRGAAREERKMGPPCQSNFCEKWVLDNAKTFLGKIDSCYLLPFGNYRGTKNRYT